MEPARLVRTPDHLAEGEEWDRRTDDDDVRGVSATCADAGSRWPWQVGVAAAEHVRSEPLEGRLRAAVAEALRSVPGVIDVAEQDRELWVVSGDPSGEALLAAVGSAVDQLASEIREHLEVDRLVDDR